MPSQSSSSSTATSSTTTTTATTTVTTAAQLQQQIAANEKEQIILTHLNECTALPSPPQPLKLSARRLLHLLRLPFHFLPLLLIVVGSCCHHSQALYTSATILPPPQMEWRQQHSEMPPPQEPQQWGKNSNSSPNHNNNSSSSNMNPKSERPLHLAAEHQQLATTNHTFRSYSIIDGASAAETEVYVGEAVAGAVAAVDTNPDPAPIFDFGMPRNITGRTGQAEAIIKCRVDILNDKSVSWIRKRDLHILTVGMATYTSDKRFQVSESRDAHEWWLHVRDPQKRDSGTYECQVNTEPKISMAFQLNIIEIAPDAKAIISGPADLHFKVGSAIILNCLVKQPSVKAIGPIHWYRGEQMITPYDDNDNAVIYNNNNNNKDSHELTNDIAEEFATRIAMESQLGDTLKSRLRISNAQTTDTGNYTCQPTTAHSASVMVHVINDENPAAMQKSAAVALYGFRTQATALSCIVVANTATAAAVVVANSVAVAGVEGHGTLSSIAVAAVVVVVVVSGSDVVLAAALIICIALLLRRLRSTYSKAISSLDAAGIISR